MEHRPPEVIARTDAVAARIPLDNFPRVIREEPYGALEMEGTQLKWFGFAGMFGIILGAWAVLLWTKKFGKRHACIAMEVASDKNYNEPLNS